MAPRRRAAPSPTPDSSSFLSDPELAHLSSTQKERLNQAFDRAGESKAERELGKRRDKKRRRVEEPQPEAEPQVEEGDDGGGGGGGFILDDDDDDMGGGFLPEGATGDDEDTGGGFMVDDDDEGGGGGFLPEEPTNDEAQRDVDMSPPPPPPTSSSTRSYLPLSLIPAALALAHLPPADSGVLDFFKKSAQGWEGARSIDGEEGGPKEKGVSRRDWFAVCAILLSGREEEMEGEEGSEVGDQVVEEEEEDDDEEEEEDVFDPEDVEEEDEDDEDGGFVRSRPSKNRVVDEEDVEFDIGNSSRRRTRRTTRSNNVDDDDIAHSLSPVPSLPSSPSGSSASSSRPRSKNTKKPKPAAKPKKKPKASNGWEDEEELVLSRAEKKHAKETFELLLGTEGVRKGKQVLEIKDVGAAVKTLKEGWSLEEVKEMVSMFSTAPDKASLTLKDLERLMWEGGLFP